MLSLKLLVVLSASMGAALPVGSLAFVVPQTEYHVGDVVTFEIPNSEELLTHRVVRVKGAMDEVRVYETRGDANNAVDDWTLTSGAIVGKVVFHLPFLGYLLYLPQVVLTAVF